MTSPNEKQKQLIDSIDGIYLVDAGAGTGKTFTITRRYANILRQGVEPDDIFLATFTNNAADQMKERIVDKVEARPSRIYDAPISTFHSFAKKILRQHGFHAPEFLGLEEKISQNLDLMESKVREKQEFQNFIDLFIERNNQYSEFYRLVDDYDKLLDLLKNLASKGIVPQEEGWYGDSEKYLDGDYEQFKQIFKSLNSPQKSSNGRRQSELRNRLYSYRFKNFEDSAPTEEEIRGGYGTKQVRKDFCRKAFKQDREKLKEFLHELYISYLRYSLRRNYLNFNFLLVFAYVLVAEDAVLREKLSFKYVMIDEFQDTNEIQFKLALLLSSDPNICVVGDWKQSIYSFQYANVENIQRFQKRIETYRKELNQDQKRVEFSVDNVEKIRLDRNYRSTQQILNISEEGLCLPATQYETVPEENIKENITSLKAQKDVDGSIEKILMEDEAENLLAKIQEIVGTQDYTYGEERELEYGDIAVLTRTRSFGLDLQKKAQKYGVPVAYEGGVELFKTNPAVILLAWLRILSSDSRRGWAVVLENAGYSLDESDKILEQGKYPDNMTEFKKGLEKEQDIGSVANKVFDKYGIRNGFTEKILEVLTNAFKNSYMNLGQLIQFIEDNIDSGEVYEVDNSMKENVVKIQTIHSAKGLEYPAVFISDINSSRFPSTNGNYSPIAYDDIVGLRTRKTYSESQNYVFDDWKSEILFKTLSRGYDEERRLMYVGITRAEQHLFFTAENETLSMFFSKLPVEHEFYSEMPEEVTQESAVDSFEAENKDYSYRESYTVTGQSDVDREGDREEGRRLHRLAEKVVENRESPEGELESSMASFIESLEGEKTCEVDLKLPVGDKVLQGRIDLLVEKEEGLEIYDLKSSVKYLEAYRQQLSIYYHAVKEVREKDVKAFLYDIRAQEVIEVDPLGKDELLD